MTSEARLEEGSKAERLAFAAYLISVLSEGRSAPNRTQLHKAAYLLESMGGVPHGFPFALHLHGPYSFELDAALSELSAISWLRVERDTGGFGARYTLTDRARDQLPRNVGSWRRFEPVMTAVGKEVLPKGVADLELLATAWYVEQELRERDEDARVKRLAALKPHFSEERIRHGFEEVRKMEKRVAATRA